MTNLRLPHAPYDLILKAVIICDDFAFAAETEARLRRIGHQADVKSHWIVNCWPVSALSDAALADKALAETLDAHLIVLPARCAQFLSGCVSDWLGRWAALREIQAAALAVIGDDNAADAARPVSPELFRFIHRHQLQLIIDEASVAENPMRIL